MLIKNSYLIDPKSGKEGIFDILIEKGKISKIAENIEICEKYGEVIDAEGLLALPGLVDVHVHFRDPGFTQKEDIFTGAKAAAKGGFTTVVLMANTNPVIDCEESLRYVTDKAKQTPIHVFSCANVTMGMKGEKITPMKQLAKEGAVGFTDDGVALLKEEIVMDAMEEAVKLDMPISFHEENPVLISNNGVHKGKASEFYQIGGSPREAEISLVERDLKLAIKTGACVNIQHISTKEAVELVRQAKKHSSHIHAEATPHHFTLTQEAVITYGTLAKVNPPLREEEDRLSIIQGLMDNTIDIIATDHAPHTAEEKQKSITEAPSGMIGLETALSLAITYLVDTGYLTMKQLLEKISTNPAEMYHLDAGYLGEGGPADLILVDSKAEVTVGNYVSKSANTPFTGWKLHGKVKKTICKGQVVYEDVDV